MIDGVLKEISWTTREEDWEKLREWKREEKGMWEKREGHWERGEEKVCGRESECVCVIMSEDSERGL